MTTHDKSKVPVIMQIIPELGAGGAEQGCIDIAAAIMDAKGKAIVVSQGGSRVYELARSNTIHINLPVKSKNPFTIWRNIRKLRKIIQEHNVDIVHARSRAPAWSAYKACQGTHAHYMTTFHAAYGFTNKSKLKYNAVMAKGERAIAVSHYIAKYITDNYDMEENRIRVIQRGISLMHFNPGAVTPNRMINLLKHWRIPDGSNIVLMPARVTRIKGHSILIDAMARLRRSDVICVIIGSDQGRTGYSEELDALIAEKGLNETVRIIDHCDDMPAAYMLANAVVVPSIKPEGFGRVPVEAQAMGRPVIATNIGGVMETVVPGETGWLIPPEDPRALATALDEALSLTEEQRNWLAGRTMHHVANNFTKEIMCDQTLNVYAELLEKDYAPLVQQQDRIFNPMQSLASR